jgi:GalNAc-alpha-(1->4)-GalNAc-alpha-(1->3)-diNAcBac-PP-undecaprenol alpha-1,4-N-acetyl-D-galactosaminyltransferase
LCRTETRSMTGHRRRQTTPPRLVLVIGSLQGGGAERQLTDMANYWKKNGIDVTVATWDGPGVRDFYPLEQGVSRRWLELPVSSRLPFSKLRSAVRRIVGLRQLLRQTKPDAVLSFIAVSNIYTILAAFGLGVRVVVAERTHPAMDRAVTRPWQLLRRVLYPRASAVVAQTRDAATWIESNCGARVVVIPNALRSLPSIACEREHLILAVGRLSKEKGFDLLLKAFSRVCSGFPSWNLRIIGEGSERSALIALRDELGLTSRVELVGDVQNVEFWMARAGLLAHPSRREGFPNVVLEAMGMGAAVIATNCRAGPSELIENDVNGRLVAVDDEDALVIVMSELMGSPVMRDRLGRAAASVRQHYEQRTVMDKWEACLLPDMRARCPD